MPGSPLVIAAFLFAYANGVIAAAETRTWSDTSGKFSIEATFAGVSESKVRLRRENGKVSQVELSRLSAADRSYISSVVEDLKAKKIARTNRSLKKVAKYEAKYRDAYKDFIEVERERVNGAEISWEVRTKSGAELQEDMDNALRRAGLPTQSFGTPAGSDFAPINRGRTGGIPLSSIEARDVTTLTEFGGKYVACHRALESARSSLRREVRASAKSLAADSSSVAEYLTVEDRYKGVIESSKGISVVLQRQGEAVSQVRIEMAFPEEDWESDKPYSRVINAVSPLLLPDNCLRWLACIRERVYAARAIGEQSISVHLSDEHSMLLVVGASDNRKTPDMPGSAKAYLVIHPVPKQYGVNQALRVPLRRLVLSSVRTFRGDDACTLNTDFSPEPHNDEPIEIEERLEKRPSARVALREKDHDPIRSIAYGLLRPEDRAAKELALDLLVKRLGIVDLVQIPEMTDDVIEWSSLEDFPMEERLALLSAVADEKIVEPEDDVRFTDHPGLALWYHVNGVIDNAR
jgi:hypothetical protein